MCNQANAVGDDLLVAGATSVLRADRQGRLVTFAQLPMDPSAQRLDDGSVDPVGRFIVGTLALGDPSFTEQLFSLDIDGSARVIRTDLGLSNDVAWSPAGTTIYHVDSLAHTVARAPYDPQSGDLGEWRTFVEITDDYPRWPCVDGLGGVWVAVWGTGTVRHYSPDGSLCDVVQVPAANVTSAAFAGADLRTLVITSAHKEPHRRRAHPRGLRGRGVRHTHRSPGAALVACAVTLTKPARIVPK